MKYSAGFTLVEIISTIAIGAILAAIAVPGVLGYVSEANDYDYAIKARSVYNVALVEQDKYQVATGLSVSELYQDNPELTKQIVTQVNGTLNSSNLRLNEMVYFAHASHSDALTIPANSYLLNFTVASTNLNALITETKDLTIIDDDIALDFVTGANPDPSQGDSPTTELPDDSFGDQDEDNANQERPGHGNDDPNQASQSQFAGIDFANVNSHYNSLKTSLVNKFDKANSAKLTREYQKLLLKESGYPVATSQEKELISSSGDFYWVPIVTPNKNAVFFGASYDSQDKNAISTTLVCLDGKYYQYVNIKDKNGQTSTYSLSEDGSDHDTIAKAQNINDQVKISQFEYWVRIK